MIALDTSLLVRLVTRDDPRQAEAALERIEGQPLFLPKTVLLELEWVLRYSYRLSREAIGRAFEGLLSLGQLRVEDRAAVTRACAWHAEGMDFADALHLASSSDASTFLTFDKQLARQGTRLQTGPSVERVGAGPAPES